MESSHGGVVRSPLRGSGMSQAKDASPMCVGVALSPAQSRRSDRGQALLAQPFARDSGSQGMVLKSPGWGGAGAADRPVESRRPVPPPSAEAATL